MESPPKLPIPIPSEFKPDTVIGTLLTIEGAFHLFGGVGCFLMIAFPAFGADTRPKHIPATNHIFWFPSPFHDWRTLVIVAFIQLAIGGLFVASGARMRRSQRNGFILAVITAALTFLFIGYVESLLIALYVTLRLSGKYGKSPS